ncbi:MAG: nuclease, partial [Humibacillus sp.]|nr:nuclease [Humibacillus sp.]
AGDERTKGQLMADTLVELVTGQTTAQAVPVEVQVVITDRALIAGDDTPAHVPGYGPVPAGWARDLFTRAITVSAALRPTTDASDTSDTSAARPAPAADTAGGVGEARAQMWLRRLYTHPGTGTLVGMDSTRRLFPAGLRRFVVARDGTCRTTWCDAPISHADHITPHANGGATSAANGQGLCVRCNLVKEQPGWTATVLDPGPQTAQGHPPGADDGLGTPHRVQITTPTGHTYHSTAPPLLPQAPPSAPAPDQPAPAFFTVEYYVPTDLEFELVA